VYYYTSGTLNGLHRTIGMVNGTLNGLHGTIGTVNGTLNGLYGTIGTVNGTLNDLHGTIRTENEIYAERFARNDSNGERLERFGHDLKIYISETLAVYYCRYYYLDIYSFVE
jgi:hypothetical protein